MEDSYEPDEPAKDVLAAFEQGQRAVTQQPIGYRCQHAGIVVGAGVTLSDASVWCGCQMEPVYAASPWASNSAGVVTTPTWRPFDTNGAA